MTPLLQEFGKLVDMLAFVLPDGWYFVDVMEARVGDVYTRREWLYNTVMFRVYDPTQIDFIQHTPGEIIVARNPNDTQDPNGIHNLVWKGQDRYA